MKQNCWEILNCGRQAGGAKIHELGVCKASTDLSFAKINGGKNSGRYCWHVSGTLCDGQVQGSYLDKTKKCLNCKVFQTVQQEQGAQFEY